MVSGKSLLDRGSWCKGPEVALIWVLRKGKAVHVERRLGDCMGLGTMPEEDSVLFMMGSPWSRGGP